MTVVQMALERGASRWRGLATAVGRRMTFGAWGVLWLAFVSLPAHALSGTDVAYLVNQRYQATPDHCFADKSAYECSGVLMRTPPSGTTGDFWRLSSAETASGTARLTYVRRDIATIRLDDSAGFILADRPTAVGNGQSYDLVCGCPPPGAVLPPCAACPGDPTGVGVSAWNAATPGALAVQAIFYDMGNGGQLAQALQYQKQYYDATRQWVPVLRVLFGANGATVFGFDVRDQLDEGYAVAQDLEARHADTAMTCPGNTPGYNCSGVLIRVSGYGATFHSWNPSPNSVSRNGVSFSYARADLKMTTVFSTGPGVIMRELQSPTAHPIDWRCSFPTNAGTSSRSDSCNTGSDRTLCDARGINTAADWKAKYGTSSNSACGLAPTVAQFGVLVDLRQTVNSGHNEIIIAAWPQNIPEQIPLEAFFYSEADDKSGAQFIQKDYMATTGRFMPIVRVQLNQPAGQIFTYDPADQVGAMPGTVLAIPGNGGPYDERQW